MKEFFRSRGAAALLCLFFIAGVLVISGCGRKYEPITLSREETLEESEGRTSEEPEELSLEDDGGAREADGAAVADLSALTGELSRNIGPSSAEDGEDEPGDENGQEDGDGKVFGGLDGQEDVSVPFNGHVVAIDAGHQAKGNSEKEPIGPGSTTLKAKVAAGATGIVTKLPEYELTLSVSKKVKALLEEKGYRVVMIRETNDVNISNAERAEIANESGASIFVRIHANSLDNSSVCGTLSMCQTAKNPYNGELHDKSYSLSKKITDAICAATGFKNRGVQETDIMSGINWCTIPVSIVEMGFMSNPEEDQKMAQEEYQDLIAGGIVGGIDDYFSEWTSE